MLPRLAVLWFSGMMLRLTVLALPPVLPQIHQQLGLSQAALAALTTLPVLLLALGAPLGSAVIGRAGPRLALLVGLAVIAVASGLRGAAGVGLLFALTFVMGLAIAAVQPAMPDLVQRWVPRAAGRGTATWVNGMLVGEVLAASLTLAVVVPLTGGWRGALAAWSVPVLGTAVLAAVVRGSPPGGGIAPRSVGAARQIAERPVSPLWPPRWLPDWRSGQTWRLGLLQGVGSALYFGVNTFLPTYLHAVGRPDLVGVGLTVLNAGQLPASLLIAVLPTALSTGPFFVGALGLAGAAGLALIVASHGAGIVAGAGIVGFVAGGGLTVALTLPVLVAGEGDAHRVSAGMFTIGYMMAFVLPLLGGAVWDATGQPVLAFLPSFACAAGMFALASTLRGGRPRNVGSGRSSGAPGGGLSGRVRGGCTRRFFPTSRRGRAPGESSRVRKGPLSPCDGAHPPAWRRRTPAPRSTGPRSRDRAHPPPARCSCRRGPGGRSWCRRRRCCATAG